MASKSTNLTCSGYPSLPFTLSVSFSETSYSVANNTSALSFSASIKSGGVAFDTNYNNTLVIKWFDNNANSSGKTIATLNVQDLSKNATASTSGTATVTHLADGSLSGYAQAIWTRHSSNASVIYVPASGNAQTSNTALTTIPRASSITSVTGTALGSAVSVAISRASSSFTHKVEWKIGASAYVTASSNATTSASFTPAVSYATQYPNSTRCACTVRVTTYNGSTQIGDSVTSGCWLDIPSSVIPTCSAITLTRVDNGVPSSWGVYVQGYSKVTASISGTGIHGSTISSYYISGAGKSTNSSSLTSGVLTSAGTYTFTAYVKDSRGRQSSSKTASVSVYDYYKPSISVEAKRCTSDGTADSSGTYLLVTCSYGYASVNGKNSRTRSVSCNGVTTEDFSNGTPFVLNANCSISAMYTVTATITDGLGNTTSTSVLIPTAERIFNVSKNGKAWAFGGFATKEDTLQVHGNLDVSGNVEIAGSLRLSYFPNNDMMSNVPVAGALGEGGPIGFDALSNYKSFLGSFYQESNSSWYNMISVRHRNGSADGNKYGMYIRCNMTTHNSSLKWNQIKSGELGTERTILDSYNYYDFNLSGVVLRNRTHQLSANIGLDSNGNYLVLIWHGSHASCGGLYFVACGSHNSSTKVKAIVPSDHVTSMTLSGTTLNITVDSYGGYANVYRLNN